MHGIGDVWSAIKTQKALNDIKQILRNDAKEKGETISNLLENIDVVVDNACVQYDLSTQKSNPDYTDIQEKLNNLRLALYNQRLALFLDATYKAALKNKFQDEYSYPTLFDVNEILLSHILNLDEKHSSDDARINYYREKIYKALDNLKAAIENGERPTVGEALLGMDSGLTGVAIYYCNPNETISMSDDGKPIGVDEDTLDPDCVQTLKPFASLFEVCCRYKSTSPLAFLILNNQVLYEECEHIIQLFEVPEAYRKRMILLHINTFLTGVLAFMVAMLNDIKWYWSLAICVLFCIIMAILSPYKVNKRRFLKKLNYVENTIKVTALKNAGYTESINLHDIDVGSTISWVLPVICAIIGCVGHLPGAIVGFCIGYGITKLLSPKDGNLNGNDYRQVATGGAWIGYFTTVILIACIILTSVVWINGSPKSKSHSSDNQDYTGTHTIEEVADTVVAIPRVFEEVDATISDASEDLESEVISSLYSIYFLDIDPISDDGTTPTYSSNLKSKFTQFGISRRRDPYTSSFKKVLEDVAEAEVLSGSLILDSDLLCGGQEGPYNLDVQIESVLIIDTDNAELKVTITNGNILTHNTYIMKRENGVFKIDDFIDDGVSLRKTLNEDIKAAIEYAKK